MNRFLTDAKKAVTGGVGVVAEGLALGLIPHPWDVVAGAVIAVATVFGIYHAPGPQAVVAAPAAVIPPTQS